jgi:hypothetical protein
VDDAKLTVYNAAENMVIQTITPPKKITSLAFITVLHTVLTMIYIDLILIHLFICTSPHWWLWAVRKGSFNAGILYLAR